ncbi:MAG: aminotransferase, partial [Spirochaeta sp.]
AHEAWTILGSMPQLRVSRPEGGFFISPVFSPGALPADGSLPIENDQVGEIVEKLAAGAAADARFVYYLLGATGICVVPLSGFCSDLAGFRMTLLESDGIARRETFLKIREAIVQYCASAHTCVSA